MVSMGYFPYLLSYKGMEKRPVGLFNNYKSLLTYALFYPNSKLGILASTIFGVAGRLCLCCQCFYSALPWNISRTKFKATVISVCTAGGIGSSYF